MSPSQSIYFATRAVDWLVVGAGSIFAYFGLLALVGKVDAVQVNAIVLVLVWAGNMPHFAATNYRLYRSVATIRQYPFTALLIPLVVLAGIQASLLWPTRIAPYFIKLYILWSPFHYSGQTLGISLAYCRRAGITLHRWERLALEGFIYGTFLSSTARAEAEITKIAFFGIQYPTFGIPVWIPRALEIAMWICGAATLAAIALRRKRRETHVPAIAYVPAAAQFFWFIPGPALSSYFQLVPFFHGIQYLLIAWFMQMRERIAQSGLAPTARRLAWETLWWGVLSAGIGRLLFVDFPRLLGRFSDRDILFIMPVAIAGVQIHHFFVDGVIWKLRNPNVASPLLGSFRAMLGRGESAVGRAA